MVLDKLTQRAKNVLKSLVLTNKAPQVGFTDVLSSINSQGGLGNVLLSEYKSLSVAKGKKVDVSEILRQAYLEAIELKHPYVGTEHLLLALLRISGLKEYKSAQKRAMSLGTYPKTVKKVISSARKTPILNAFGTNLNQIYEEGFNSDSVDRSEVSYLSSVLLQKRKYNALLLGENGVGRSTVVRLLAQKIANYQVPSALIGTQIVEFDLGSFLGSVIGREGLESGLSSLHEEILSIPNIILFIKDIHVIFMPGAGGMMPSIVGSLFKTSTLYSGIQFIASTSPDQYQRYIAEDVDFLNNFSVVKVKEPDKKTTLEIIGDKSRDFERFHNTEISKDIIYEAYTLSERYLKSKRFPQKGIELLDKACALMLSDKSKPPQKFSDLKNRKSILLKELIKAVSNKNLDLVDLLKRKSTLIDSKLSKIKIDSPRTKLTSSYLSLAMSKELDVPVGKLTSVESHQLSTLKDRISAKIIGQDKAVEAVTAALIRGRLGLRAKGRSMGNFLFLGPTGVGKTELAKVLSKTVFGESALIRLDMSDFSERHTVSRLVGAPPGYVGYSEGGELTEKIARNPYSVVLFDEIEKAHPDVLNILLQIMDEGELMDGRGRVFDFSNAIVILTSNIGSELVGKEALGFSIKNVAASVSSDKNPNRALLMDNLKQILKPELLNRFDETVTFDKLNSSDAKKILEIAISDISVTLKEKNIVLKVNKRAKQIILKSGYSDEYGARALKRTLDKLLVDKLADLILNKKLSIEEMSSVFVGASLNSDELTFKIS